MILRFFIPFYFPSAAPPWVGEAAEGFLAGRGYCLAQEWTATKTASWCSLGHRLPHYGESPARDKDPDTFKVQTQPSCRNAWVALAWPRGPGNRGLLLRQGAARVGCSARAGSLPCLHTTLRSLGRCSCSSLVNNLGYSSCPQGANGQWLPCWTFILRGCSC